MGQRGGKFKAQRLKAMKLKAQGSRLEADKLKAQG